MAEFYMTAQPAGRTSTIRDTIKGPDVDDLFNATVRLTLRKAGSALTVGGLAEVEHPGECTVSYTWKSPLTAGRWYLRWEVTKDGQTVHVPTKGAKELWVSNEPVGV